MIFLFFFLAAVRFGRVPKREKARILAAMQQSTNSRSQEKAVTAELEDEQRLLGTVIRAHLDTCDFTKDKIEPMIARAREQPSYTACPPTLVSISTLVHYIPRLSQRWWCVPKNTEPYYYACRGFNKRKNNRCRQGHGMTVIRHEGKPVNRLLAILVQSNSLLASVTLSGCHVEATFSSWPRSGFIRFVEVDFIGKLEDI